jgi:type II secretory pathway component PulK
VFWLEAAKQLFQAAGIQREVGERGSARVTYSAEDQVAVIHDWIDADNSSFTVQGFTGQGSERQLGKVFFANRPLVDLSELLLVPGFSSERAQRIAPFVTTAQTFQVNVNTAPPEVLTALAVAAQVPATLVNSLIMARLDQPFTSQSLSQLLQQGGNQPLLAYLTTRSSGFTAYARVTSANRTRWASAAIKAGSGAGQKATLERRALY